MSSIHSSTASRFLNGPGELEERQAFNERMHHIRNQSGFTLVEMLMVISIISILFSLLAGALVRVQSNASSMICQNNLKLLAIWGTQYADQWGGILPTSGYPGGVNTTFYSDIAKSGWWQKCKVDLGLYDPGYFCTVKSTNQNQELLKNTVLACPSAQAGLLPRIYSKTDYGLNLMLGGRKYSNTPQVPKTRLLNSHKFWFGDVTCSRNVPASGGYEVIDLLDCRRGPTGLLPKEGPWMWAWTELWNYSHPDGRANYVYGDGHIQSMQLEQYICFSADDIIRFTGTSSF